MAYGGSTETTPDALDTLVGLYLQYNEIAGGYSAGRNAERRFVGNIDRYYFYPANFDCLAS